MPPLHRSVLQRPGFFLAAQARLRSLPPAENVAEKPDQGEVIAVGKGKILEDGKVRPLDVKVGDRILFGKFSGQAVKVEGTEYLVMREDDIMGVVAK